MYLTTERSIIYYPTTLINSKMVISLICLSFLTILIFGARIATSKHTYLLIIKTKKMNQQSTLEQLQELKLAGMAKRYEAILNQPVHQQPEPHALIATLAEAESGYRIHQRTELYLRLSKLRYHATPEQINCTPGR